MRVLIVKRDKLGDLLLTMPVIARLASALPHAEIHLLANDYNAWVVDGYPSLARTWTYPRARDGGRLRVAAALSQLPLHWRLRRQRFEWAFVMGGDESHRGIRRAIVSGAARVVAYAREPADYGERLTDPLPPPVEGHETARMLALLAPLGLPRSRARNRSAGIFACAGCARGGARLARRPAIARGLVRGDRRRRATREKTAGNRSDCSLGDAAVRRASIADGVHVDAGRRGERRVIRATMRSRKR